MRVSEFYQFSRRNHDNCTNLFAQWSRCRINEFFRTALLQRAKRPLKLNQQHRWFLKKQLSIKAAVSSMSTHHDNLRAIFGIKTGRENKIHAQNRNSKKKQWVNIAFRQELWLHRDIDLHLAALSSQRTAPERSLIRRACRWRSETAAANYAFQWELQAHAA